ncbi:MAG TPA: hypothetical protein RMH99_20430 [Sandaracinaceae bacterium LLY-WYZ-13_1]|nr:hypothetical protein [Sandaracinaceae bacterium LLY-WYZ-13_1]
MEIYLRKRAVRQIRLSAQDAIEEGDTDTLREDIIEAFTDDEIEEIERRVDSGDFYEFISDVLEEWAGDEVDDLFELLEAALSDVAIEIKYNDPEFDDEDDEDDDDDLDYDLEDEVDDDL